MAGNRYLDVQTATGHDLGFDESGLLTVDGHQVGVVKTLALSANSATPAINTDKYDAVDITAQTAAITSLTAGLSGTPVANQMLKISFIGTGTFAITHGADFESSTVTLPTTTSGTNRLDAWYVYNAATSKWRCVLVA
jgi:hypothetical protein